MKKDRFLLWVGDIITLFESLILVLTFRFVKVDWGWDYYIWFEKTKCRRVIKEMKEEK